MQEYATEAIVLEMYPSGDYDARYSLFTKKFGKLIARAKSVKKITSKLAGHLQIGNRVRARLIEKKGLQVVDALKQSALGIGLSDLYFLDRVLHEAEPDHELWELLTGGDFNWRTGLKILGWDPAHAECAGCAGKSKLDSRIHLRMKLRTDTVRGNDIGKIAVFHIRTQEFYCSGCASKVRRNEVILLVQEPLVIST
jgi:recombinational DNA repair protein (RecF pathway)